MMKKVSLSIIAILFYFCSTAQDKPFILGIIKELDSRILSEKRVLNIYLPAGYKTEDSTHYPVIYLLDGSADEDFIHITGLVQFANFPWVNWLPPSIVVGIANTDRRRDFCFPTKNKKDKAAYPTTGGSGRFMEFLGKELQPFIDSSFRTSRSKMLIGQSLGGLFACEILYKQPELFNSYLIVSPSLWWDDESLLTLSPAIAKPSYHTPTRIFIAVGKEGAIMEGDARKLTATLKAAKNTNLQTDFTFFGKADHGNILHQAVYKAFETWSRPKKADKKSTKTP